MTTMSAGDLALFPATPAQITESRTRSFVEWRRSMTLEEYLSRDAIMDEGEHAVNGKLTTWVLCPSDDPESLEFKCSCETYRRDGVFIYKGNQNVENAICYGIASVFTPQRYRRKGYARQMMRLVHKALENDSKANRGLPVKFSALWSDVGAFYESCGPSADEVGWTITDAFSTTWDVKNGEHETAGPEGSIQWDWLTPDDLPAIWEEEMRVIKSDLAIAASLDTSDAKVLFSFLPSDGVEMFQRARLTHVSNKITPPLDYCGATRPDVLVTWTVEERPATLLVTRLRVPSSSELKQVLHLLVTVAQKHNLDKVEIWNMSPALRQVAVDIGWVVQERKEHLPAFKWYGAEDPKRIIWRNNERFCWC